MYIKFVIKSDQAALIQWIKYNIYERSLMNVCIFNNIFEYLQASPADYEKAVVAAKEAWETWAEVTGINQILPL